MLDFFKKTYYRLLDELSISTHRYLYPSLDLNQRLTGIVGQRGVGKTTLMLQFIKEQLAGRADVFYFSADNFYFEQESLLHFVNELYETEGIRIVFIDEIHKYPRWNQELKNIYDAFPSLTVFFSGSSNLDLVQGSHDLSRRAILLKLTGLSFREYLNFTTSQTLGVIPYAELLENPTRFDRVIAGIPQVKKHFATYLEKGFYPFVLEDNQKHYERVARIVEKAIYEDIANYYNLKTANLHYFKKILNFLASVPPGKINANVLANNLQIDNKTAVHYLEILAATNLIERLFPFEGGNQQLRKPKKLFLNNTTLLHALNAQLGQSIEIGTLRELFFIQATQNAGINLYFNNRADFRTADHIFEIGGKNKTAHQIKDLENAFLIKDNISTASGCVIPLHYFGFLY